MPRYFELLNAQLHAGEIAAIIERPRYYIANLERCGAITGNRDGKGVTYRLGDVLACHALAELQKDSL